MKYLVWSFFASVLLTTSLTACHHKDEVEKSYMNGFMDAVIPEYVLAGSEVGAMSQGIQEPSSGVTYRWTNNFNSDTIDCPEGGVVYFTLPKDLGTYTITHTAMAEGYYNTIQTFTIHTIIPYIGGSLKNVELPTDSIQDPRDAQWYYVEEIGNLIWFSENLNYAGKGSGYAAADDAGYVYGRLYTWEDATDGVSATGLGAGPQGACPDGWSVPTNEDWEDLAEAVSGESLSFLNNWEKVGEKLIPEKATFNGDRIWPYSAERTTSNDFKWSALAGGYSYHNYLQFYGLNEYAFFWSSSESDENNAYYRYLYYDSNAFPYSSAPKSTLGASVRCVKLK